MLVRKMITNTNPVISSAIGSGFTNIVTGSFWKRSYQSSSPETTKQTPTTPTTAIETSNLRPKKAPKRERENEPSSTMYRPVFQVENAKPTPISSTPKHKMSHDGLLHSFELPSLKDNTTKQFKAFKIDSSNVPLKKKVDKNEICNFLNTHLGEFGDGKEAIMENIGVALNNGSLFLIKDNSTLVGVLVVSDTGFNKTMPKNFIGYVAIHQAYRDEFRGLGRKLLEACYDNTTGDICLHCDKTNPRAIRVYESMGFIPKYLEMRWSRDDWENNKQSKL